jgi:hypothetical protein
MIILNNAKDKSFIKMKLQKKQDYSESGSVIYPRGTLIDFEGKIHGNKSAINKKFHDSIHRENIMFMIESVNQLPFKKDDIIIDDMKKEYIIVETSFEIAIEQHYFKSALQSKRWFLGVQGDE